MKAPFILITYGFTQKLFTWETEGAHKLPVFGDAALAALFVTNTKDKMEGMLEDKEPLQVQVCTKVSHATDMFKIVAIHCPEVIICYNAAPMVEDPQEAVGKIASRLGSLATVINKEYAIDEWLELLENQ